MAQQAVSKSVATLETQLGVTLLIRSTREVSLTPAGAALLAAGPGALAAIDAAFGQAADVGRALAGTVRVGVSLAVGAALHPTIAAALTAEVPGLHVTFSELRPPEIWAALRRDELDVVITRIQADSEEFTHAELAATPAVVLVSPAHPLADRESIAIADLDGGTLQMWSPPGDPYTDGVVRRLAAGGARVAVRQANVVGSAGPPSLGPDKFAVRAVGWPVNDTAVTLALTDPGLSLPLWVYWNPGSPSAAVERLRTRMTTER